MPSLNPAELNRFRALIREKSGLEFPPSRRLEVEKAAFQALDKTGATSATELFTLLADEQRGRPVLDDILAALTIGETHFFRHQPQFEALEGHILPELIARRRLTRHLRIWSAGCASGEEPYSLAILLEKLLPDLSAWTILILATDINEQALEKARRGRYGSWSFRQVPPAVQSQYFIAHGPEFEIAPRLRQRVTLRRFNLVDDAFPISSAGAGFDLILCRNVLIYFAEPTVRKVVNRLHQALAPEGWLIVGHTEPCQAVFDQFVVQNFPGTVMYRKGTPKPVARPSWQPSALVSDELVPPVAIFSPPPDPPTESEPQPAAPPWETAFRKAKDEANRLHWDDAQQSIEIAVQIAPLAAPAHHLHGLILQEKGLPEEALAALRRCVYADASFVLGHFSLASLLDKLGQRERARKASDNVVRLLQGQARDQLIPGGDGLTVGRLLELVELRKQL